MNIRCLGLLIFYLPLSYFDQCVKADVDCDAFKQLYSQIDEDIEILSKSGGLDPSRNADAVELYCQREDIKEFHVCLRLHDGRLFALTPVNEKILKGYAKQALGMLFSYLILYHLKKNVQQQMIMTATLSATEE
jgi:hypothetical protein